MDSRSSRCWQLSFVLWRWRWILWLVLLAALLGGLGYHAYQFRRQKVIARLQIEPPMTSAPWHPSTSAFAPASPGHLAYSRDSVLSSSVLAIAAEECGLTGLWRCSRQEAAVRLDSLLTCHLSMVPLAIAMELPKIEGADSLKVCEAIVRQATYASIQREQARLRHEIKILEGTAETTASAAGDFEKAMHSFGSSDPSAWLTVPGSRLPTDDRAERARRLRGEQEGIKRMLEFKQLELKFRSGPLKIVDAPHWETVPLPERMQALGLTLGWALGGGMVLAIVLAYLAEAVRPRRDG